MKLVFFVSTILSLIMSMSVLAQKQYSINGTAPEKYNGNYVYMTQLNIDIPIDIQPIFTDSVTIKYGKFTFKDTIGSDTLLYLISLGKTSGDFIALNAAELKVEYVECDPIGYFRVSGTVLNEQLTEYMQYSRRLSQRVGDIMEKRKELLAKNEWSMEDESEIGSIFKVETSHYLDLMSNLVKDNINNSVGQYILMMSGGSINQEIMAEIEPKLSDSVKQRIEANKIIISDMMNINEASDSIPELVKQGNRYVDFEGETLSGAKTKLSLVIKSKKLILLDFWASWCAPCIKEMPEFADLYDKYKDKGLEIVSVSLDSDRTEWKNRIKNKKMTWFQFIDSDMSNLIKNIYGVKTIPHTVLIDENGMIIANKLRGKALKEQIEMSLSK